MDYTGILKKSWGFIKRYKYLWLLGILSGGASFNTGSSYQYGGSGTENNIENIMNGDHTALIHAMANSAKAEVSSVGKVLGESIGPGAFSNIWIWISIVVFTLVLIVLVIYISITARSAIVWSVSELDKDKRATLKDSWRAGHRIFWRRLSLAIVMCALIIIPMAILSIPVVTLAIFEIIIPAVILGLIFGLVYLAYLIYVAVIFPYSERFLVLDKIPAIKSLYKSKDLLGKSWREIILMYLIIFGIRIAAMIVIAVATVAAVIILIIPTIIIYAINHIAAFALGGLFAFVLLAAFVVISGVLNAYTSSCVTLTYNRIK